MYKTRVTTNGRITIPAALRKKYGLNPGRRVRFVVEENGIKIIPLFTKDEISANAGVLGLTSLKPGKKGKMLKSLVEEKKREREL